MVSTPRVIFAVLVLAVLTVFAVVYLRSWMGKPVKGTLRVPQGKNRVSITVCDDASLRPFKYGQVFDAVFSAGEQALISASSGERCVGIGMLSFRNKPFGLADQASSYTQTLSQLAELNQKVIVQAVITSLDAQGRPVIELRLPNPKWFVRALKASTKALESRSA